MLPIVLQCREGTCGVLCVPFIVDIGAPLATQMVVNTPSGNSIGEGMYLHVYYVYTGNYVIRNCSLYVVCLQ